MSSKKISKQRIFEDHGVVFSGESGDQLIGKCPFTDKEDKFYVNRRTWLWDSKTAGLSGNIGTFLRRTAEQYVSDLDDMLIKRLAAHRQLPVAALRAWEVGWDIRRRRYTIPVRDISGHVVDIRHYRITPSGIGTGVKSTPGVQVGLLGAHHLPKDKASPIYLCEGEWDAMAMHWMLRKSLAPGIVVAVPGSGTFKAEWVPWFAGRQVYTLYDKDGAGEEGEHVAMNRLYLTVQKLHYVHWPNDMPSGFDVRDWYIAHKSEGADIAFANLKKLFKVTPKVMPDARMGKGDELQPDEATTMGAAVQGPHERETRWKKAPRLDDVMAAFKKWLHLESTDAIRIMLGCVVSQAMDGPPVWVFLVGPPGSAKTAVLASLTEYPKVYSTSSLTVHALISGANWKDSADPSLIPRLNGKVMVVKDFTSILSMRDTEKDEIFGILRDAYDGKCGKVFGNGVERNYTSRFTILAAVTPRIYDMGSQHAALGERFLKYAVGDNLVHTSETEIISRAIQNINQEQAMNDEFQDVVNNFLDRRVVLDRIPIVPKPLERKIVALAMFGARLRGSVTRDTYRNDIMTSRPSAEIGSRLGIQLAKLGKALAMVSGKTKVDEDEYRLLKKVMLDTIPQRNEDLVRVMLKLTKNPGSTVTSNQLGHATRYPSATIQRLLQDMNVLDIVVKGGTHMKNEWAMSPYIRGCVTKAELYETPEELNRPTRLWIKVVKKKRA